MTGAECRQRRALLRITQDELAERAGIHRRTVVRFEAGQTVPSPIVMAQIGRVLDEAELAERTA